MMQNSVYKMAESGFNGTCSVYLYAIAWLTTVVVELPQQADSNRPAS